MVNWWVASRGNNPGLLIGVGGTRNRIEGPCYANTEEVVVVVVVRVAVLVVLINWVACRNVVQIIVEGLPNPKFKGKIPPGIIYVFESQSKGYRGLNIAVLCVLFYVAGDAEQGHAPKKVGRESNESLGLPPVQEMILGHHRPFEKKEVEGCTPLLGEDIGTGIAGANLATGYGCSYADNAAQIGTVENCSRWLAVFKVIISNKVARIIKCAHTKTDLRPLRYS